MPIETSWIVQDLVLEIKMIDHVTYAEYMTLDQELLQYLESNNTLLSGLVDSTKMISQPTLRQLQQGKAQVHQNVGWLVEYGLQNSLLITMSNIMARLTGIKYRQFKKRKEAIEFLSSNIPELETVINADAV